MAISQHVKAIILDNAGHTEEAKNDYVKAYDLYVAVPDSVQMGNTLENIAGLWQRMGNSNESMKHHIKAEKIFRQINNKWGLLMCLNNVAGLYNQQMQSQKAMENYRKVIPLCIE